MAIAKRPAQPPFSIRMDRLFVSKLGSRLPCSGNGLLGAARFTGRCGRDGDDHHPAASGPGAVESPLPSGRHDAGHRSLDPSHHLLQPGSRHAAGWLRALACRLHLYRVVGAKFPLLRCIAVRIHDCPCRRERGRQAAKRLRCRDFPRKLCGHRHRLGSVRQHAHRFSQSLAKTG